MSLTFDDLPDRRLRICLQGLPSSFSLPAKTVDLLRIAAGYLLMKSDVFVAGMRSLDPSLKPRQIIIAPALFDEVCGPVTDMFPGKRRGGGGEFQLFRE